MSKGYNQPVRLLYSCPSCSAPLSSAYCVNSERWMKGNNHLFEDRSSPWATEASDLLRRILSFNQKVIHSQAEAIWEPANVVLTNEATYPTVRLKDPAYSPVHFQKPTTPLRARFGIRRLPWRLPAGRFDQLLYGVSYGATAAITQDKGSYRLTPLLFPVDAAPYIDASLLPGEGLRFWIRWRSTGSLEPDSRGDRFTYACSLEARPRVFQFNTFFRVPEGFDCVPGSATDLRHYPVPPRLFFLWSGHTVRPEQCFSYHRILEQNANVQLDLSTQFSDKRAETERLLQLFLLGTFLNLLVSIAVRFSEVRHDHTTLASSLHLQWAATIGAAITLAVAVRRYRRRPVVWPPFFALIALALVLPTAAEWAPAVLLVAVPGGALLVAAVFSRTRAAVASLHRAFAVFPELNRRRMKRRFLAHSKRS